MTPTHRLNPWTAVYAVGVVAVLYFAREPLLPIALAILIAFLFTPVVGWVEKRLHSRLWSVGIVAAATSMVAAVVLALVAYQFVTLASQLPAYRETIVEKIRDLRSGTQGFVGNATDTIRAVGEELAKPNEVSPPPDVAADTGDTALQPAAGTVDKSDAASERPSDPVRPAPAPAFAPPTAPSGHLQLLTSIVGPILGPIITSGMVVLLAVMMLLYRENLRDRVIRLAGVGQVGLTSNSLAEAGVRVSTYLRAQFILNSSFGVVIGTGLYFIGVPSAIACGLLAAVLRFVPFVGPVLAFGLPAVLALGAMKGWASLAWVAGLFAVAESMNNLVFEPMLYSRKTGVSSFGVVIAIIFWTWLWGTAGLVMAMPITVCVLAFAAQFPKLGALYIILGDEPPLPESLRLYQRLLVGDDDEAAKVLQEVIAKDGPVSALDAVLLPALSAGRRDWRVDAISDEQLGDIARTAREIVSDVLADSATGVTAPITPSMSATITCIPCNDACDETAAIILALLLKSRGYAASVTPSDLLLSEQLDAAKTMNGAEPPDTTASGTGSGLIVLSCIEPASATRTRRVLKMIHQKLPRSRVVLARWGAPAAAPSSDHDLFAEHASGVPDFEATTFAGAVEVCIRMANQPAAKV